MEGLAPTYRFCLDWRLALERGESTLTHLSSNLPDWPQDLQLQVRAALKNSSEMLETNTISLYRRALLSLIAPALRGESVLNRLKEIEKEILQQCEHEMEQHLNSLSLRLMLPMMLFQFPAFLILLLGPLLNHLTRSLQ